jgi:cytochrome c nitrite reductase small subunit
LVALPLTASAHRTTVSRLAIVFVCLLGIPAGVGAFTFVYAKGFSYLSTDPRACVNCHVMREQYDGWIAGSHRVAAVCNDCHAPHDVVGKYWTKARNGFWHSFYFTTGRFLEPIQITRHNREVTEGACRHCHTDIVQAIDASPHRGAALSCLGCHASVGHLQ